MKKVIQVYRLTCFEFILFIILLAQVGCKKWMEVPVPPTNLADENVFSNDATASAVLTDIYASISADNNSLAGSGSRFTNISLFISLATDELILFNAVNNNAELARYFMNDLVADKIGLKNSDVWKALYNIVFRVNAAIEGLEKSTTLTPVVKSQLSGEAKFLRAYTYFYLTNLYGNVPLALTTDFTINSSLSRSPIEDVYKQMISDLLAAKDLLSVGYLAGDVKTGTADRVRPTRWAASALLARVYLYYGSIGDPTAWTKAETAATEVISHTGLFNLTNVPLNQVFKKNSLETIWALQPVGGTNARNPGEGRYYILPASGPNLDIYNGNPVYLSDSVINDFEAGDQRRSEWTDSVIVNGFTYHYAHKYKEGRTSGDVPNSEYIMMLRLAEQYLVRAEARARQGNFVGASSDINILRNRAGLSDISVNTLEEAQKVIRQERRVELFTEGGDRWFDLVRTGEIQYVMPSVTAAKGGIWAPHKALAPIPQDEIDKNPALQGHQNAGY